MDPRDGVVCSPDRRASVAGLCLLAAGGNAVDAAIGASAVLAVVAPNMCGLGGDLMAVVAGAGLAVPRALLAAGPAGSGASAAQMRSEGLRDVVRIGDVRAVTVPGCVDGWLALHAELGRLPLSRVLAAAIDHARDGFAVSPLLAASLARVGPVAGADDLFTGGVPAAGELRRHPALADTLTAIIEGGRDAFYGGAFGRGLLELGRGLFVADDLALSVVEWSPTLSLATSHGRLHTVPAPSQGYITLLAAAILDELGQRHPGRAGSRHLQIEAFRAAGFDRSARLGDGFDARELLTPEEVGHRADLVEPDRAMSLVAPPLPGGTVAVTVVDSDGGAVALTQSNASGFGSRIVVPEVGVWLHNRGSGFSLRPGAPNELHPGARPAHTLAPLIVDDGPAVTALATRGGDTQPQILLQLLAGLATGSDPVAVVDRPRWMVAAVGHGAFDVWRAASDGALRQEIRLEDDAPRSWEAELVAAGHDVRRRPRGGDFGHAQLARRDRRGRLSGGTDPRAARA